MNVSTSLMHPNAAIRSFHSRYTQACSRWSYRTIRSRRTGSPGRPPTNAQTRTFHANRLCYSASSRQDGFNLYDSLSETCKPLPLNSTNKGLAWYTCGPTTYAPAHLGHARTYVCLDIVRRVLEHHLDQNQQPPPLFVMNITDVDDKILAASQETGEPPLDLGRRFEHEFWRDMDALNCLRPHVVTRVSEYVLSDIVPYIQRLCDQGMAYEIDDGVYFDLRSFDEKLGKVTKYGKLAPPSIAKDFFSLGNTHAPEHTNKKDPRDFVLWKKQKEGEALSWDSPWGEGRPGWHIECSAMIEAMSNTFKDTHEFTFHAGGVDLKFPHHANEIAQAEAYNANRLEQQPREWIPHWVHTGHLHIDGLKMSKSLKNFVTIEELLEGNEASSLTSPADDFRLWCLGLAGTYRGQAIFSMERIHEARVVREKLVKFLLDGSSWLDTCRDSAPKKWTRIESKLYAKANESFAKSQSAILNDLDGKVFLQELVTVAEMGNEYLRTTPTGPTEALEHCLTTLRKSLSLVGFSEKTVRVGSKQHSLESPEAIVGGTRALIEELVNFRSGVRNAALVSVRNEESADAVQEILRLCDESRDHSFASIGLQLVDGDRTKSWRYCLPQSPSRSSEDAEAPVTKAIPLEDIPLEDYFKMGQYEGMFSEFNDEGFPITNVDGSGISNRQMKKLMTKRQKHVERLRHIAETKAASKDGTCIV